MTRPRAFAYDGALARWWMLRADDPVHGRAYGRIADFIAESYVRPPRVIVDYACGAGHLLALLSLRFRRSRLIGLDGSEFLLGMALRRLSRIPRRCSRRIALVQAPLPDPELMRRKADLAVFCFPNMVPAPGAVARLSRGERALAQSIAKNRRDREMLAQSRLVSRNLRQLLRPGGICVRVEYGKARRGELPSEELRAVCYEEGSLEPRPYFRVSASCYFRSRVLEDVYQQTGDQKDRHGGYVITVLRAVGPDLV